MTVYLQEAKRNPHPDSRTVDDINCFLHNHPCTRCTNHHEKFHDGILSDEGENVPKNTFCGCALNCTLYSDRGTMDIFQNRIFNLLNQDELEEKVASYFDGRRLFDEMDAADLPDDLHPNAQGYIKMGERFADAYLKKAVAHIM